MANATPKPIKKPIELATKPIWKQQPGEADLWFHRFNRWLRMLDPDQGIFKRSIRQVYHEEILARQSAPLNPGKTRLKISTTLPNEWCHAGKQYRWTERKEAFDKYNHDRDDALWDERMKKLREKRWTVAETFFAKAETMLKMPLVKQTVTTDPNGHQVTIIEPINWTARDVVAYAKTGSDIGGSAVGDVNWAATLLGQKGFEVNIPAEEPVIPDIPIEDFEDFEV